MADPMDVKGTRLPVKEERRCTAHSRSGAQCKRSAALGSTVCASHGGKAPQVKAAAARRLQEEAAQEAIATYGLPVEVEPHTALLEELHRSGGHVRWLGAVVAALDTEDGRGRLIEKTMFGEQPAVWIKLYKDERRHFADVARACVAAGIEERRVKIAEAEALLVADVFRRVYDDPELGLTAGQRKAAMTATARHLRLVASEAA